MVEQEQCSSGAPTHQAQWEAGIAQELCADSRLPVISGPVPPDVRRIFVQIPLMNSPPSLISVVVPVYKGSVEHRALLAEARARAEQDIAPNYEDPVLPGPISDDTEAPGDASNRTNPKIRLLVFSRRFGQPAATMAGIFTSKGETCVVIDVDLQDQPELIADLYRKLREGYEVVYAQRRSRKGRDRRQATDILSRRDDQSSQRRPDSS